MSNNDDVDNPEWAQNPKKNMCEDEEEVTRKIAPAMVVPSFGAMPSVTGTSSSPFVDTTSIKAGITPRADNSATRFVWELTSAPTLPEFHTLEQTCVLIPNTTPTKVAPRISDVLRERSIEAEYDNQKAIVKCITLEGVEFRVRLYRGKDRKYNHWTIVEVQRFSYATSLNFHNDVQAILDRAQGKDPPPHEPAQLPPTDFDEEDHDLDNGNSCLAIVIKMMNAPGFESQYLALKTLSSLVDSQRIPSVTTKAISIKLFQSDNEVGIKLFDYIVNRPSESKKKMRETEETSGVFIEESVADDDYSDRIFLRNMSLGILSNAMRSLDYGNEKEDGAAIPPYKFLREPLQPVLLQDLREAKKHPNTALLSAECMEFFIRVRDGQGVDTLMLREALEIANKVGKAEHKKLMQQTEKCMSLI